MESVEVCGKICVFIYLEPERVINFFTAFSSNPEMSSLEIEFNIL